MNNEKQSLLQSDQSPGKHNQTVAYPERPNNVSGGIFNE
jgi:hypothetical protein